MQPLLSYVVAAARRLRSVWCPPRGTRGKGRMGHGSRQSRLSKPEHSPGPCLCRDGLNVAWHVTSCSVRPHWPAQSHDHSCPQGAWVPGFASSLRKAAPATKAVTPQASLLRASSSLAAAQGTAVPAAPCRVGPGGGLEVGCTCWAPVQHCLGACSLETGPTGTGASCGKGRGVSTLRLTLCLGAGSWAGWPVTLAGPSLAA